MSDNNQTGATGSENDHPEVGGRYAKYVLGVLVLVYIFNFVDRQILSILAENIKADLGITDAQIGFLYGTAFAVFYAVFGIPLGRLADTWTRKSLISVGLLFWSAMTALSGTARSFGSLATYRIGVGVGEASATPAAFSMLSDYFSPRMRTTALAIYSSGVYIGAGIGIFLGGVILDFWNHLYPNAMQAPMHLKGWHVAFFAVGLPGVLMSLWVWTLREPARGLSEGHITPAHPHPFREAWLSLAGILPGFNLVTLTTAGGGAKGIGINLVAGIAIALVAWLLIKLTGTPAQWIALGVGLYATFSWAQNLAISDPATFAMIFKSRTVLLTVIGFPSIAFTTYGLGFWGPPFFQRVHHVSASQAGTILGLSAAVGGWAGVTLGGVLADKLREKYQLGKIYVGMASALLSIPLGVGLLVTDNLTVAYVLNFFFSVTSPMWIGPAASTVNDLVMPRMRAIVSAFYILMVTFIGLALGPYSIGLISDTIHRGGATPAEALRHAMLWGTSMLVLAFVALLASCRFLKDDEDSRFERARALGEEIPGD
ncbi:MAG TPA: MFS transporter [Pseudomonadales bacterium]|nr:MFS transporter [Pseudomonadales bacterium]